MQKKLSVLAGLALLLLIAAGCANLGPQATPAPPTKTPKPTFTPVANVPPTALPLPTATRPSATPMPTPTAIPPTALPQPTAVPATATPVPGARFTTTQNVNVRGGPGTNYGILGELRAGQSLEITGKNPAGDWYQFDYSGQRGWVSASLVTLSGNAGSIQVAQNIPAPPPTARPQPTAVPQPTTPPARRNEYNVALVQRCDPQEAGTWFRGTVYRNRQPVNDVRVVFSWVADGEWSSLPVTSGPHAGYPNWNPGFYEHIISASANGPRAGTWFIWLVDANGSRISDIASWTSSGKVGQGQGCNEAVVDFDSR